MAQLRQDYQEFVKRDAEIVMVGPEKPDAFRRYWRERHGPLVERHAEALGARRYVQSHTLADDANALLRASRAAAEPYDGITEVWWDDRAAFEASLRTPEGQAGPKLK